MVQARGHAAARTHVTGSVVKKRSLHEAGCCSCAWAGLHCQLRADTATVTSKWVIQPVHVLNGSMLLLWGQPCRCAGLAVSKICAGDAVMCITDSQSPNVTFRIDMHSLAIGALRRGWQPHVRTSAWLQVAQLTKRSPWEARHTGSDEGERQHQQHEQPACYF